MHMTLFALNSNGMALGISHCDASSQVSMLQVVPGAQIVGEQNVRPAIETIGG